MSIVNPHMLPKVRSERIMQAANGQPCSLRIASFVPGYNCSGRDTTIGAHLPVQGKGTSTKVTDLAVAFSCDRCHRILDGASDEDMKRRTYIVERYPTAFMERLLNGLVETHARLVEEGIIEVPDADII